MALVNVPPPRLPEPPEQIEEIYGRFSEALQIFITQERNPGELRGTKITLTDLPTSATGLETGALYNDSGTVKGGYMKPAFVLLCYLAGNQRALCICLM